MQENKTLGSAINKIDNCNTTEEYLDIKFIPEDICDNFIISEKFKHTVIDIISIIIFTVYYWKGKFFYDNTDSDDDGSVILSNMLDQSMVLRLLKNKMINTDINDDIINFLNINFIAYTIQTLKSYKNIIVPVGEKYIIIFKFKYSKLDDIVLFRTDYIEYIKSEVNYSANLKIYAGDTLSNKGILL